MSLLSPNQRLGISLSAIVLCGCSVVSLRHLERQLEREKEKSNTELAAADAVHRDEVEKLTDQLKSLQADNNLLMVTRVVYFIKFCQFREVTTSQICVVFVPLYNVYSGVGRVAMI